MALRRNTTILTVRYHVGRAVEDGIIHAVALFIDQEVIDGEAIRPSNGPAIHEMRNRFCRDHGGVAIHIPEEAMQGETPDDLWARKEFPNAV